MLASCGCAPVSTSSAQIARLQQGDSCASPSSRAGDSGTQVTNYEPGLVPRRWKSAKGIDGRIRHFEQLRRRVADGGVHPSIRREVWEFLLGVYSADSTGEERDALRLERRSRYKELLSQWQEFTDPRAGAPDGTPPRNDVAKPSSSVPESNQAVTTSEAVATGQETNEIITNGENGVTAASGQAPGSAASEAHADARPAPPRWLDTQRLIHLDVDRTDRQMPHFSGSNNANLARLHTILSTYVWTDPSTGYCQGMNDLVAPFVVLFDNDADAFWAFYHFMQFARFNFRIDGRMGVHRQMDAVASILRAADVPLFNHLTSIHADDCLFAFRMLLVSFRRELSLADSLVLWEVVWAVDFEHLGGRSAPRAFENGISATVRRRASSIDGLPAQNSSFNSNSAATAAASSNSNNNAGSAARRDGDRGAASHAGDVTNTTAVPATSLAWRTLSPIGRTLSSQNRHKEGREPGDPHHHHRGGGLLANGHGKPGAWEIAHGADVLDFGGVDRIMAPVPKFLEVWRASRDTEKSSASSSSPAAATAATTTSGPNKPPPPAAPEPPPVGTLQVYMVAAVLIKHRDLVLGMTSDVADMLKLAFNMFASIKVPRAIGRAKKLRRRVASKLPPNFAHP